MMNKLIKTDTIWYKITKFFKNIFYKTTNKKEVVIEPINNIKTSNFKENLQKEYLNTVLAENISNNVIEIYDLDDDQIKNMEQYYRDQINNLNRQIEETKKHIIYLQKIN